jgi:hypothetical protein
MTHEIKEYAGTMCGVKGRFRNAHAKNNDLWSTQTWVSESRPVKGYGAGGEMSVHVRFDDECGNGHNSFSITAEVRTPASNRRNDIEAGGCMHKEIARVFPELEPLLKWHLTSSHGPMHYIANTIYHASDRDYNGLLKGERRQIISGRTKLPAWKLAFVDAAGNEVEKPESYVDGETQPECNVTLAYVPWCNVGEGKERNFDAARSCAVWPEATDEQLSAPREELKAVLEARHADLMAAFRNAIDSTGFAWSPSSIKSGVSP